MATLLGALLSMAALSHTLVLAPAILLPLLLALMAPQSSLKKALGGCAAVWALVNLALLGPLPRPELAYRIDFQILDAEAPQFQDHWSWGWRALSWVVLPLAVTGAARLPSVWRRGCFLGLLGVATLSTLWSFDSARLAELSRVRPSGYGHDHYLYQETWRLMKEGQDYYSAAAQAFRGDLRGQGATVRPPLMFYLWALVCPLPPLTLFVAYSLLTVVALLAAYETARRLGAGEASLIAAALMVPQYVYGAYSAGYLFMEYWVLPLGLVSLCCLLDRCPRWALSLALLAALCREFMVIYFFGLSLALLYQQRKAWPRVLLAWVAWLCYYAVHESLAAQVMAQNHGGSDNLWRDFYHGGLDNLAACVALGSRTLAPGPWMAWVVLAVGTMGLARLRGPALVALGLGVLPYFPLFLVLGHIPVSVGELTFYPTEPWGAYFMLWWPVLVALALAPGRKSTVDCS